MHELIINRALIVRRGGVGELDPGTGGISISNLERVDLSSHLGPPCFRMPCHVHRALWCDRVTSKTVAHLGLQRC